MSYTVVYASNHDRSVIVALNMAVDRMQWGAEKWQFADLYTPDVDSPYTSEHGIPCVMLIHGGFWKENMV